VKPADLDALFRRAVQAIDAGDVASLERILAEYPALAGARLDEPGTWLRDKAGNALDDFFRRPYLLWFVAEDPVRNGTLPPNIAAVAQTIVEVAKDTHAATLQEQLDHALRLVSWSWIARQCGVQIALIDVLADAGAALDGNPENALVNGNVEAAAHLVKRGATLTLAAAMSLGYWDEMARLAAHASARETQFAFVLAALRGNDEALQRLIARGVDVNRHSEDLYSHATALHHAVCSGSIDAVRLLVEAGANLSARDSAWNGTPLDWADHYRREHERDERGARYAEIAAYLRDR
jgi:hypothetical protein